MRRPPKYFAVGSCDEVLGMIASDDALFVPQMRIEARWELHTPAVCSRVYCWPPFARQSRGTVMGWKIPCLATTSSTARKDANTTRRSIHTIVMADRQWPSSRAALVLRPRGAPWFYSGLWAISAIE